MLQRAKTRVFPLHLAPIDDFFLVDDRPDYPMVFTSHLKFTGQVQREAFEPALVEALGRHPLLQALIKPAKGDKPCWVLAGDLMPRVDWGPVGKPFTLDDGEAIDLTREVGLRVWVRTSPDESEVLLQFHHACCDGTGAYRFIGDLLAEYGMRSASEAEAPVVEVCDIRLLKDRRGKMVSEFRGRLPYILQCLALGCKVFGPKVSPLGLPKRNRDAARRRETRDELAPDYPDDFSQGDFSQDGASQAHGQLAPYPGIETILFSKSEYKSLREAASRSGAMFNDLLVCEMLLAITEWNKRHGKRRRERWRIMMPTDLREKEDILMPAANLTAYSFITRSSVECGSPTKLLQSVRDETLKIKREKPGKRFIDAVMATDYVPGLLKFLLNRKRCLATVILSNVGDPTRRFLARFPREGGKIRCGNLRLEQISGVPPLRPMSRATLSIVTYGRQLAINVRCDRHTMSRSEAQEFLRLFAARLSNHLPVTEPDAVTSPTDVAAAV